jgi:hypothetical protein
VTDLIALLQRWEGKTLEYKRGLSTPDVCSARTRSVVKLPPSPGDTRGYVELNIIMTMLTAGLCAEHGSVPRGILAGSDWRVVAINIVRHTLATGN